MVNMHQETVNRKRSLGIVSKVIAVVLLFNLFTFSAYAKTDDLDAARFLIKAFYVDKVSNDTLNEDSVEDMVKSLGDPYTEYFSPEEYENFTESIDKKFSGIGVHVGTGPEGPVVLSVIKDSPSEEAGLKAGDIITMADNHKLAGISLDLAASYMKGEEGTTVRLKVKRDGKLYTYDVARREITLSTVEGKMLDKHTAYINISSFGQDTGEYFKQKLEELSKQNPDNYIIDLRNNGGGYLKTAAEIAGNFIGKNTVVLTRDKGGRETKIQSADTGSVINKPIIFLVNEYSASASEILSAAVKDYGAAYIVGTRTYGKGTVQSMFKLPDGSVLKLSIQRFFSPLGNAIEKVGVTPDFEVKDVDSLAVAELLSGKSESLWDKRDFMKIKSGEREFEIDLKKARTPNCWKAFNYIIDKAVSSDYEISVGTLNGWVDANDILLKDRVKLCYAEYNETSSLENVPVNKKFTVIFNDDVEAGTVNSDTTELMNAATGERLELNFKQIDSKNIEITPNGKLERGGTYYLIINSTINGEKESTITKVNVKK